MEIIIDIDMSAYRRMIILERLATAGKKVKINLTDHSTLPIEILNAWRREARKPGWSEEEIDAVYQEADPDIDFYRHIDILNLFSERIPNKY